MNCTCVLSVAPPAVVNLSTSESVAAAQERASMISPHQDQENHPNLQSEDRKRGRSDAFSDAEDEEYDPILERELQSTRLWKCDKCTFINEPGDRACAQCDFDPDSHEHD